MKKIVKKGLLGKIKPYTFTLFAKKYGEEKLLDCLERNEKNGVLYHRAGVNGDYDDFGVSRTYGYKRNHLGHDMMGQVGTPICIINRIHLKRDA